MTGAMELNATRNSFGEAEPDADEGGPRGCEGERVTREKRVSET